MHRAGAWCSLLFPNLQQGPDSISLFPPQRSQASHPLLPPQPLVLQLAEHLLVQPQPEPQLRQLQHQPQPQPDSQPPQPLAKPQPQPQLQQPQQLGERRLLSPAAPPLQPRENPPRRWKTPWGGAAKDGPGGVGGKLGGGWKPCGAVGAPQSPWVFWGSGEGRGGDGFLFLQTPGWGGTGWASTERGNKLLGRDLGPSRRGPQRGALPPAVLLLARLDFSSTPKVSVFLLPTPGRGRGHPRGQR